MPPVVLVLSPDPHLAAQLTSCFGRRVDVCAATNTTEAEKLLQNRTVDVLVCRDELPGETGLMFLARHVGETPWQRRILICAPLDSALVMHVINEARVFRCLMEPYTFKELLHQVEITLGEAEKARALFTAAAESDRLRAAPGRPALIVENWLRMLPKMVFLTAVCCGGVFLAGVATLFGLYLLKSILGIDLIPEVHLADLWR